MGRGKYIMIFQFPPSHETPVSDIISSNYILLYTTIAIFVE